MFNDLREFMKRAEELGQLKLIEGADWNLEIGQITQLMFTSKTPALLFDKIKGYKAGYRVISSFIQGDLTKALAFGLPLGTSKKELIKIVRDKFKEGIKPIPPVEVKTSPVMENIHIGNEVDLFEFPTPKWHQLDGGRYIGTGDLVIQRDPDEGWVNLGTYRVQVVDKTTAAIFMSPGKHGDIIRRKYWDRGLSCPVAVVCGVEPVMFTAGAAPMPLGFSEYDYVGWLRNKPVEVVRGKTTDLPIPASSEIVLEGELVPPGTHDVVEGPFGEYPGYYASKARNVPGFEVKCVLHRNDPIITGSPPLGAGGGEDVGETISFWIRAARLWKELDERFPGITGVRFITEASGQAMLVIALKQMYSGHAKSAALYAAGFQTQAEACRWVIVVDDDIDPFSNADVFWALGTRCEPATSIEVITGCCTNELNPMTSPEMRSRNILLHSRAIILACKPYDWIEEFPPVVRYSAEVMKKTKEKWGRILYGQA